MKLMNYIPVSKLSLEEKEKELDILHERWSEILDLPTDEFLSDEIGIELNYIHRRTMELIRAL